LRSNAFLSSVNASQADVAVYKAVGSKPDAAKFPNAARWYTHIASYSSEFETLAGDKAAKASDFGPEAAAAPAAAAEEEDDDDVDLFGSDDEDVDEAAEKLKQQRLAEYAAKKAAKGPKPAAKSIVTLDVKPWDDETNLDELLANVKAIEMDGLVWGGHQFIAIGFGIKKLQINCVIEDDKVSMDDLQEAIAEDEDHVQSSDVAAMQKL
jgi:elongation factor 1-beta